jgi:hypothetical protein
MLLRLGAAGLVLSGSTLLAGCGGTSFDGRVFRNDELSFRVLRVPSSWHAIEAPGSLLAFRDDRTPASVSVSGRCGKDGDDVPLESLTHHLFLNFTERKVVGQERLTLDGREALKSELVAKLDGVPKQFMVYVLKKNGCVYDFAYVAPAGAAAEGQTDFVAFVESFSTISP